MSQICTFYIEHCHIKIKNGKLLGRDGFTFVHWKVSYENSLSRNLMIMSLRLIAGCEMFML